MSASPLNRRSAALYGAELTQPGYQQRIAESPKYEHEYLRRLADPTPFPSEVGDGEYHEDDDKHHYTPDVYPRLKRLDDIGFIRPKEQDGKRRLLKIVDDHARDESKRNEDRPRFKLRDYVEITDAGRNYLALAGLKYL
jgi:hypothetical protein